MKDPGWGINAAYKKLDRVVYLETRVGPIMPEIYRQDMPDGPQNEMDMRFVDQDGHTFYAMRGGDTFVDPTWAAEIDTSRHSKFDASKRALDFGMAREAAQKFTQIAPAGLKDHTYHLNRYAANLAPSQDPERVQRAAELERTLPDIATNASRFERGYNDYNYGAWSIFETDKYQGDTGCAAWICVAKHSATRMWDYRGYYDGNGNWNALGWAFVIDANNHGRHATDSGMNYDCYSQGGWVWNGTITGGTAGSATGNYDGQGGCQTSYNWNSGGYDHLCNDDAAYELWQAKNGGLGSNGNYGTGGASLTFQYRGPGWGGHGSDPWYACNCGGFNGCNNDWNTPNCP
jgi:hypothetical protein